jgi:hypothetical protein
VDVYDRLQPDDLKQISVIVASFVYEAALRDQMLPRKPIEKALPREPEKKEGLSSGSCTDLPTRHIAIRFHPAARAAVGMTCLFSDTIFSC